MSPELDQIYQGDALEVLQTWPDQLVDLCVTSPAYYRQRDYGVPGQLGLEASPEEYIDRLVVILQEVRRVLKDGGSLYVNLGDSFQDKSLLGLPWRVALALKDHGWLIRGDLIWNKTNFMPSAVKDRFGSAHENLLFLTKSPRYYFNLDRIRIPHQGGRQHVRPFPTPSLTGPRGRRGGNFPPHPLGRAPGDVWSFHTENRPKRHIAPGFIGHFAPFPEALCERPILASCPPGGIVLDPFIGSGTTAVVARRLGRRFLGIELSDAYVRLARRRLAITSACSPGEFLIRSHRGTPLQVGETASGDLSTYLCGKEAA